jgi:hypothetical protein
MIARPNKAFSILSMINLLALHALMELSLIKISIFPTAKIAQIIASAAIKTKLPVKSPALNASILTIFPMMVFASLMQLHVSNCSLKIGDILNQSNNGITPRSR